jgi:hypothetical protein
MFFAAFTSRSCRVPHDGHVQCRVDRLSEASRCPHAEQVLDDGQKRSITITRRPARCALYSIMRRKAPQPQSETLLAREWLRAMFLTARSSSTITS